MNKERVLHHIEQEWKTLLESFKNLKDDIMMESGAVGYWSVRDVLAHITTWDEEALKILPLILEDKPTPRYIRYGGIDAFNAREQERKRDYSLELIKQQLVATHKSLVNFLAECPDSAFTSKSRFIKRLRLDTINHYREHINQIIRWRAERNI